MISKCHTKRNNECISKFSIYFLTIQKGNIVNIGPNWFFEYIIYQLFLAFILRVINAISHLLNIVKLNDNMQFIELLSFLRHHPLNCVSYHDYFICTNINNSYNSSSKQLNTLI